MLIFLAELSYIGMFDIFSLMEILKDLINEAEKVNKNQNCSQTVDFYLEILVSALPHLIDNLEKNTIIEYKNLIQNISSLMMNKQQMFNSNN